MIPHSDAAAESPEKTASRYRYAPVRIAILALAAALTVLLVVDVATGEQAVSSVVTPTVVLRVFMSHVPLLGRGIHAAPDSLRYIDALVWEQRAPRVVGGALVGVLLAEAGVAFQSLLMNPLADPYTVGVSSGSALGAMAIALWGSGPIAVSIAQPAASFATGMAAVSLVYMLARLGGKVSSSSFLLAGMNVGMFFWSLIPLMLALANRSGSIDRQSAIISQLLGNLEGLDWARVGVLAVITVVTTVTLLWSSRELDLMSFGEETAAHAGVDTERFKRRAIVAGSLATATAVAMAGIVAFVGLIVPHIARRIVGPRHAAVMPAALLLGALLLVGSDWISRVFLNQIQIGVVTSLIGAPLFCYLLRRRMEERS